MSDPDPERLDERLRAVERAVTDGDRAPADVADAAEATDRIADTERTVEAHEERLADLEAAVRALRGYVGNVRSVNREVERRADTAVSVAEDVRRRLDEGSSQEATTPAAGDDADDWPTPWNAAGDAPTGDAPEPERSDTSGGDPPRAGRDRTAARGDRESTGPGHHGRATPRRGRDDAPDDENPRPRGEPATETAVGDPTGNGSEGDRPTWDDAAWPGADEPAGPGAGSDGGTWPPDGMDVDRAQPWSVPDPGGEEWDDDEPKGLLERVRESL